MGSERRALSCLPEILAAGRGAKKFLTKSRGSNEPLQKASKSHRYTRILLLVGGQINVGVLRSLDLDLARSSKI